MVLIGKKRNIIRKTQTSPIMLESRDKLGKILQQFTSNKTLDTKASVVAKVIKPRPVKKGRVTVKPPPPPPPKPVIIKTPPKVYYFYQCTGNGKVGRPSLSRFGKSIKPTSKGGGGGCYQMLSAFFSYEDMNGNTIKFNLKPGHVVTALGVQNTNVKSKSINGINVLVTVFCCQDVTQLNILPEKND